MKVGDIFRTKSNCNKLVSRQVVKITHISTNGLITYNYLTKNIFCDESRKPKKFFIEDTIPLTELEKQLW